MYVVARNFLYCLKLTPLVSISLSICSQIASRLCSGFTQFFNRWKADERLRSSKGGFACEQSASPAISTSSVSWKSFITSVISVEPRSFSIRGFSVLFFAVRWLSDLSQSVQETLSWSPWFLSSSLLLKMGSRSSSLSLRTFLYRRILCISRSLIRAKLFAMSLRPQKDPLFPLLQLLFSGNWSFWCSLKFSRLKFPQMNLQRQTWQALTITLCVYVSGSRQITLLFVRKGHC